MATKAVGHKNPVSVKVPVPRQPASQPLPKPSPTRKPAAKKPSKSKSSTTRVRVNTPGPPPPKPFPTQQVVRQASSAPAQAAKPLEVRGSDTVKVEFMIGIVLIVLAPLADKSMKMDKTYVRHIIGWMVVFMFLFPMSTSSNSGMVRAANAIGWMLLLVLAVKGTSGAFGIDIPNLLSTIAAKISGSGNGSGSGIGVNGPLGGPVV